MGFSGAGGLEVEVDEKEEEVGFEPAPPGMVHGEEAAVEAEEDAAGSVPAVAAVEAEDAELAAEEVEDEEEEDEDVEEE